MRYVVTLNEASEAIVARRPFAVRASDYVQKELGISNSLSGMPAKAAIEWYEKADSDCFLHDPGLGELPRSSMEYKDITDALTYETITYMVLSYETPIWFSALIPGSSHEEMAVFPPYRYDSATTSNHQLLVARALKTHMPATTRVQRRSGTYVGRHSW